MTVRSPIARMVRWIFSKRGLRKILIILVWAVTILALLYAEENWRGRRAWLVAKRDLESRGAQLELKAFAPASIPDDQNFAATPFVKSWFTSKATNDENWGDHFSAVSIKVPSPTRDKNNPSRKEFMDLVGWEWAFSEPPSSRINASKPPKPGRLDPASRAAAAPGVLQGLKAAEPLLAELREAGTRKLVSYPVEFDLENPWGMRLPHIKNIRSAGQRLKLRACARLAAGQTGAAFEDLNLMLYLTDTLKQEPYVISSLVRTACFEASLQPLWEGLAEHRWTAAQLEAIQLRLQNCNLLSDLKRPLESERAAGILTIDLIQKKGLEYYRNLTRGLDDESPAGKSWVDLTGHFIPSGWYSFEKMNYAQMYEKQFAETYDSNKKQVFPSRIEANDKQFQKELSGGMLGRPWGCVLNHRVIASLLLPALSHVVARTSRAQAGLDEAAIACALERYRLVHKQFPEKLEALVPQFMTELPKDVVGGAVYKYRPSGEAGYVVYSIGWNEKDDGGVPAKNPYDEKKGDWIWEMRGN